jgi:hypothetical protein
MKSGGAITVKVKAILVIQQQYLYVAYSLLLEHINPYPANVENKVSS